MKKLLLLFLCISSILHKAPAQTSRIAYTTILKLNPGEEINNLLSCWKPDGNKMPSQIVIQTSNNIFSTISKGVRKDNLTYAQVAAGNCNDNPYKVQRDSYSNPFRRLLPNGKYNIHDEKKDYGTYDNIHSMRASDTRFVAVVSEGKGRDAKYFFLESEGQKTPLDGRPESLITNDDLSRSAVVLADGKGPTDEELNNMPKNEQIAYFEKRRATDLTRKVWLNDGTTFTVQRKSRLLFDVAGHHFIEIQPQAFYIDGKPYQRNISDTRTQLFVSPDGTDWAWFCQIYMGFKNNTYLQNVFHPFLTTEDGKECLNWFIVQKENTVSVLKLCQRRW
jgi:hypothetical protein